MRPASARFQPNASGVYHVVVRRIRLVSYKGRLLSSAFGAWLMPTALLLCVRVLSEFRRGRLLLHACQAAFMFPPPCPTFSHFSVDPPLPHILSSTFRWSPSKLGDHGSTVIPTGRCVGRPPTARIVVFGRGESNEHRMIHGWDTGARALVVMAAPMESPTTNTVCQAVVRQAPWDIFTWVPNAVCRRGRGRSGPLPLWTATWAFAAPDRDAWRASASAWLRFSSTLALPERTRVCVRRYAWYSVVHAFLAKLRKVLAAPILVQNRVSSGAEVMRPNTVSNVSVLSYIVGEFGVSVASVARRLAYIRQVRHSNLITSIAEGMGTVCSAK